MPIKIQPEPIHFYEKVQKKGEKFLEEHPDAKGNALSPYWKKIIPDLYVAYSKICAYTCHWIPEDTGFATVEHFKAKETYPEHAYQWSNYRLICGRMNGRKGKWDDVLDPFALANGWFTMHFPSLQLKPGVQLNKDETRLVIQTIARLKLNDGVCVRSRKSWLDRYLIEECKLSDLEKRAPFLVSELKRQELTDICLPIWEQFRRQTKVNL